MKRKLKGFTLVELIVVMALMSILMLAIMKMFQPIRDTYIDSTQYEAQRTAQNGVIQYITESVRYATDMGVYNDVSTAPSAVDSFIKAYCINNNITDTSGSAIAPYNDTGDLDNIKSEIKKYAEVIIIDNKTEHYKKDFKGRLIRRKVDGTATSVSAPVFSVVNDSKGVEINKVIVPSSTNMWRTALSESYYGENTYYITLVPDNTEGMLTVNVASTRNGKRDISNAKITNTDVTGNITRGGVFCRNLVTSTSNPNASGVAKAGVYDVNYTADNSKNAYIVFLNKDGRDKVDAVVKTAAATP
ncbi:MAG: type II secretion system GspH family protein [Oscillospiraceae bacterium]|nr:type II secretion system GspH family protein [Oscillospiraceae bacterium]